MSDMLNLIFNRLPLVTKKKHPNREDVKEFFQRGLNDDEMVEFTLLVDDKGLLEARYSMMDIMERYDMWNAINNGL